MNKGRVVSTVVLVLALGFLWSPGRQALAAESTDKTVTLEIHGMVWMSCQSAVQSALQSVKGVKDVSVSLAKHEAVVTYDPSVAKVDDLIGAVDHAHGMQHFSATLKNKGS